MEMTSEENPQQPAAEYVANHDDHQYIYFGDSEPRYKISTGGELKEILSIIAASGKFWHPWEMLQMLLSFKLKQVLSEYPEVQMPSDQQTSKLGETYPELVKRLDQALHSFIEGPPFTLQRLCEILLAARNIYPNLSKLALALEKNLLVTSTLSVSTSTDPNPIISREGDGPITAVAHDPVVPKGQTEVVQNGVETTRGDEDEEMADAEEVSDEANKNGNPMETAEEITTETPEASSDPITPSEPSNESSPLSGDQPQQQPSPLSQDSQQSPPQHEHINTAS